MDGAPAPQARDAAARPVDPLSLWEALGFAATAHANQRRKGAAQEPYVNHLIEVAGLVLEATAGRDAAAAGAALLHDVVEDTPTKLSDIEASFGADVARLVAETSDDMSLPKDERRRARIAAASRKSPRAKLVKTADLISNLRAVANSPPAGWGADRQLGYLDGCRQMMDAMRGPHPELEARFDVEAAAAERLIREQMAPGLDVPAVVARLDSAAGQPVHLVYLANTEREPLGAAELERFCDLIARGFPSAVVEEAHGIFEGARRPVYVARIRTDATEAVVALAQRLCLAFRQRFVGIEIDGRYLRIYSDDTA
jgi:hypothetical protein